MMWIRIRLMGTLLAATTVVPAPSTAQASSAAADSMITLTDEQVTHYIAVKRELKSYWQTHTALRETAKASGHKREIRMEVSVIKNPIVVQVEVFDYPSLVSKDTALAAIFTKNDFVVSRFEPTRVAVWQGLVGAAVAEALGYVLADDTSSALAKNMALVAKHRQELAAVGDTFQLKLTKIGPPPFGTTKVDTAGATDRIPHAGAEDRFHGRLQLGHGDFSLQEPVQSGIDYAYEPVSLISSQAARRHLA